MNDPPPIILNQNLLKQTERKTSNKYQIQDHVHLSDAWRDFIPFIQLKNMKNTHGGVLFSVKLQALAFNSTESKKRQLHKMVKHSQKIRRRLPTNCLGVLDHFWDWCLKG